MHNPVRTVARQVWRDGSGSDGTRAIPEETATALTYNGGTYAVMMATPQDLKDFAVGFSLSEAIVQSPSEIELLDIVSLDDGVELRMWLAQSKVDRLSERRRQIAGPTGCGLCGIDFDRRSRASGGDRRVRCDIFAATDHVGDGSHPGIAENQH